jgi:hypothetical protein
MSIQCRVQQSVVASGRHLDTKHSKREETLRDKQGKVESASCRGRVVLVQPFLMLLDDWHGKCEARWLSAFLELPNGW